MIILYQCCVRSKYDTSRGYCTGEFPGTLAPRICVLVGLNLVFKVSIDMKFPRTVPIPVYHIISAPAFWLTWILMDLESL